MGCLLRLLTDRAAMYVHGRHLVAFGFSGWEQHRACVCRTSVREQRRAGRVLAANKERRRESGRKKCDACPCRTNSLTYYLTKRDSLFEVYTERVRALCVRGLHSSTHACVRVQGFLVCFAPPAHTCGGPWNL